MEQPSGARERLDLLVRWLNGHYDHSVYGPRTRPEDVRTWTDYPKVRRTIDRFVRSFDGSEGAGHVSAAATGKPLSDDDLSQLGELIRILLEQGLGDRTLADLSFPSSSLRFAVRSANRAKPKWRLTERGVRVRDGGARAQRAYRAAGAYVLHVEGATDELIPFLTAHLLTLADMAALCRCERPNCPNFVAVPIGKRGRPPRFCSGSCGEAVREAKTTRTRRTRG
jgi:hypothetical protein